MKRPNENLLLYIISVFIVIFIISNSYFFMEPGVEVKKEFHEKYATKYVKYVIDMSNSSIIRAIVKMRKTNNAKLALDESLEYLKENFDKLVFYIPEILSLDRKYTLPKYYIWISDTLGNIITSSSEQEVGFLNSFYNNHKAEIEKDDFYKNRNEFLYALLGDSDTNLNDESHDDWRFLGDYKSVPKMRENGRFIFSNKIENSEGENIGTVHVKINDFANKWTLYVDAAHELSKDQRRHQNLINLICFLLIWILIPNWVYQDARKRNLKNPLIWAVVAFLSHIFGLIIYLLSRPKLSLSNACASCNSFVPEHSEFCTHCGTKVKKENKCQNCESVMKTDWLFCATCGAKAEDSE